MAGFTWCDYVSDTAGGGSFARKIDDYYLGQETGGVATHESIFGAVPDSTLNPLPHLITPRHVVGVSPDGQTARAVVYTTAAPIWVGHDANSPPVAVTTWTGKDKSGATITYTVTGYVGERRTKARNPA